MSADSTMNLHFFLQIRVKKCERSLVRLGRVAVVRGDYRFKFFILDKILPYLSEIWPFLKNCFMAAIYFALDLASAATISALCLSTRITKAHNTSLIGLLQCN